MVAFGTLRALPCSCTISPIALSSEDGTRCRGHCELDWPLGARNRDPSCGRLAQLHRPAMRHAVAAAGRVPWSASPYRPFFKHVTVTERGCVSTHCRHQLNANERAPIDDTGHVLLDCPAHANARSELLQQLEEVLARCGLTRDDVASRLRLIRLLLGSPPEHMQQRLFHDPTAYRDILRATARFIKQVHATRWQRA